jgi:hypothetical protein
MVRDYPRAVRAGGGGCRRQGTAKIAAHHASGKGRAVIESHLVSANPETLE